MSPCNELALGPLLNEPLGATFKGLPTRAVDCSVAELGTLGLSLLDGDLPLPAAVLKDSAIDHNGKWMRDFVTRAGVSLCPHGKTTMAPQLFQRQLDDGAWGMTAATACHVRTYRHFGVPRILLANQLVGRENIELVLRELEADPTFDFYCLVDSLASMNELTRVLKGRDLGRPLQVLLEVGVMGGRTVVRSLEEGRQLGRALRAAAPTLSLRGIEAFEAVMPGGQAAGVELAVYAMLDTLVAIMQAGIDEDWFAAGEVLLTAGGSQFFDIAAQVLAAGARASSAADRIRPVLRSGCYLSHDSLHYERMQARIRERARALWGAGRGLQPALEVWAHVQSVPEPGRSICAVGKRDLSHDLMLPQPVAWFRAGLHERPVPVVDGLSVSALNDQHTYVDSSTGSVPWRVGDLVAFGIGHPCTTFDRWPLLFTVDDAHQVTGGVRTFF